MGKYKDFNVIFKQINNQREPIVFKYKEGTYTAPLDTTLYAALTIKKAAEEHGTETEEFGNILFKCAPQIIGNTNYHDLVEKQSISGFELGCICRYVLNRQAGVEDTDEETNEEELGEDGYVPEKKR